MQSHSEPTADWRADLAWEALAHPESLGLTYACRHLLLEAASGEPLSPEAMNTVASIATDILDDSERRFRAQEAAA